MPLDYFNGTYPDETVSIAIVKLPAKIPVNDPRYAGPILLEPGGPGGEGTSFALMAADGLRAVVDFPKYFDIIGFDPRGIGETRPLAECLPDDPSAWSWALRENSEGILSSSDAALGRLWSMTHAFGSVCKDFTQDEYPDIKEYMSTASVARDMLEIVERHAEYVADRKAQSSSQTWLGSQSQTRTKYTPGEAKLQYWGFSYGTYVGTTFASMFPDRVGRLVLDGVVSSYDYNHALGNGSLSDTEKTMKVFYTFCHNAGPEECALATKNGSIANIEDRFQKIVKSLYHRPLIIESVDGPEILTFSDLKLLIFGASYQPAYAYPLIALLLADIEVGGGPILEQIGIAFRSSHVYQCGGRGSADRSLASRDVALAAILCGEGIDQSHVDIDEFAKSWELLESMSPTAGSIWANIGMRCAAWRIRAKHTFQGPFGGLTSNPILFLSNTADPVTPLRSGRIMHDMFQGSVLLIGDGAGHCSISAPNPCILRHVRAYFQTGELPVPGTVCVPPPSPFSLNSTDPKSPFYDPSLDQANVITYDEEAADEEQEYFMDMAMDMQYIVAESSSFGFKGMFGGNRIFNAMQIRF